MGIALCWRDNFQREIGWRKFRVHLKVRLVRFLIAAVR